MPATEETYRNQKRLHVVFAISSIAMAIVIVWMILADHLRPWKEYQRDFHKIELAKLEAQKEQTEQENLAQNRVEIDKVNAQIEAAEASAKENSRAIREKEAEIRQLQAQFDRVDTQAKFTKATLDSQRSLYDGMLERGENREALAYLASTVRPTEEQLFELQKQHEVAKKNLQEAERVLAVDLRGNIEELERERDRLVREVARVERTIEQKEAANFGLGAFLRDLPLMDMAAPATKIDQISLPDLTINYNFKEVPRYDRCKTCHMGIDRLGYETDAEGNPMPKVFASHPKVDTGATAIDPFGNVVEAGLYLDGNGPHPINSFGCTVCHGGQGSGTDFSFASHTPNDLEQKHHWEEDYNWHEIHHWEYPMLPNRFIESSCIKCHHQVTDIPQAEKLQAGYNRIVKYGCTGCHTIGGEDVFGPDLTDAPQIGPNLEHLGSKVSKDWLLKWLKNPHSYRPDTRMPRYYDVVNNSADRDEPKVHAEIHAMAHYLLSKSTPPDFAQPAEPGQANGKTLPDQSDTDTARGKDLFFQKGCMACHSHKEFPPEEFPEEVQQYAQASHGPNLSELSDKFPDGSQGYVWLANWVKAPERYHPQSLMPNLQLSWQEAADIASWILTVPAEWTEAEYVPPVDDPSVEEGLRELVKLFKQRGGTAISQLDQSIDEMSADEQLMYLGERTIGRLGCFGCHKIEGFEDYKPIGTPLDGWGHKSPTRLEYVHILDYLVDNRTQTDDGEILYDGTDEYYFEQLAEHTREGFLFQKLHRPRSYDYKKTRSELKAWDERLRMPQFTWADDPEAIEEIMTFVLGLTGERIGGQYLPDTHYTPTQHAVAQGNRLIERYACDHCHVLEMPKFTIPSGMTVAEAMPTFDQNVGISSGPQGRGLDYLSAFYDNFQPTPEVGSPNLTPDDGSTSYTIEGMPIGYFRDDETNELSVQVWKPVTIRGYTFNVGDTINLNPDKVQRTAPVGGDFAWLYASTTWTGSDDGDFAEFNYNNEIWNNLPPPLVRQGLKVQTPWMTRFLQDPYEIRPMAQLRMPRFHYGDPQADTRDLANYFPAIDRAEFPYQDIPQRQQDYLSAKEAEFPDYLDSGWHMMAGAGSACLQCHAIGSNKPEEGPDAVNGPALWQVGDRFRPDYLAEWLANPPRLLPYTKMPQNFPVQGDAAVAVPESFKEASNLDMIYAVRDTLLNYISAVERQLARQVPPAEAEAETEESEASGGEE